MIRRRRFQAKPSLGNQANVSVAETKEISSNKEESIKASVSVLQPVDVVLLKSTEIQSELSVEKNIDLTQSQTIETQNVKIVEFESKKSLDYEKVEGLSVVESNCLTNQNVESNCLKNQNVESNCLTKQNSSKTNKMDNIDNAQSVASLSSVQTCSNIKASSESESNHRVVVLDEDIDVIVDVYNENDQTSSVISSPNNKIVNGVERRLKRKKKSALRDEELDTKKFTLADLIDWRPKTENTLRKKWDEKRQRMLETMSNSSTSASSSIGLDIKSKTEPVNMGPRVKINEKGEMVLDEDSLVVTNDTDMNLWETVDDDLMPKKLNSNSFRKRRCTRSVNWTIAETDLFYEVLSATGTDFGLMHEFISSRSRVEIKKKFHREEKLNDARITEVLENPTILDETLYTRIERLKKRIEKELEEKILAKQKPASSKRGRPRKIRPEIEADSDIEQNDNEENL